MSRTRRPSPAAPVGAVVAGVVAALVVVVVVLVADDTSDHDDGAVVGLGDPFELEPDLRFTVLTTSFADRTGRLTAAVGYLNRSEATYGGPQFAVACRQPPAEHEWADAMLGDSIEAIGSMAAEAAGGGTIIVEYDLDRIAGCAEDPILWVRSSVLREIDGERGHRTFQVALEKPATS